MAEVTYDQVVRLAEQLSPDEQKALIAHLQSISTQRELSSGEWKALLDSVKVSVPPGPNYSDRRSDWYEDDGR